MYSAIAGRGRWSQFGLRLFLLVALAAFVAVQDPAASLHEHSHSGPHTHCCAACHCGLFLAVPASALTLPLDFSARWFTGHAAQLRLCNPTVISNSSRAPPASSLFQLV